MGKRKLNELTIEKLQYDHDLLKKEVAYYRRDNEALRNDNMQIKETLRALVQDESFWSEQAVKSGIVFRLKNILNSLDNEQ